MLDRDIFSDTLTGACITCHEPCASYVWFCPTCTQVKEAAYAVSRALGETYVDVVIRRDAALRERREARKAKEV